MRFPVSLLIAIPVALMSAACQTVEGQVEPPPRPIKTVAVEAAPAPSSLRYAATIQADREVTLAFKASGYVDTILQRRGPDGRTRPLQPGDAVEAGTELGRVRAVDYRDRLAQAEGTLHEIEASRAKARQDLDRARALFASASLVKPDLDAAQAAFDASEAQLAGAQAQIALARTALADVAIIAPITGVVMSRQIEVGALVTPGAAAFVIARVAPVKAVIGVPDTHIAQLVSGQKLSVTSDAFPGVTFTGIVTAIAPSANDQNRLFAVEVSLPNGNGKLRPGMVGAVEIPMADSSTTVTEGRPAVPFAAVVRGTGSDGYSVFVVSRDDERPVVHARAVSLGEVRGNAVVVTKGLEAGERVVISGPGLLVDGERVRIIP